MKTQIIHLESHDDVNSVKDKIDWSQTPRILLIWPEKTHVLTNRLDLILLERHCTAMGSQLALASSHPVVRRHAEGLGIPVFPSKQKAQASPWHRSQRFYQRRKIQEKRQEPRESAIPDRPQNERALELPQWAQITTFTIGVFAVLLIATLFLPRAEITIPPQDQWKELIVPVRASPDIDTIHVSGHVPTHKVSVSIEKRAEKSATGTLAVPDTPASGSVLIKNLTNHEMSLPRNTVLTVNDPETVRYKTESDILIPAGSEDTVEVDIRSMKPGADANQPAGVQWGINADIGADLSVENPQPITGGRDVYVTIPTEKDRENLKERVVEELRAVSYPRLEQKLNPEDVILTEQLIIGEIEEITFDPQEGDPGEILEMTIRIRFSGWVVKHEDLRALALEIMLASQQSSETKPDPDSLTLENHTSPPSSTNGEAEWDLILTWHQDPATTQQEILQLVLGQTPSRARHRINSTYNLDNPAQISTRPSWWPRLPFIPFRIDVQ